MKNKKTKKMFRELLNRLFPAKNNCLSDKEKHIIGQTKRGYGDYLYSQDREMFNVDYQNWINKKDCFSDFPD